MVLVSNIEKMRGKKIKITFDNGNSYQILQSAYFEKPISIGDVIDEKEYSQWVMVHQYRSALDRAVNLLANRARSRNEIRQKLYAAGYSFETIDVVLYKLEKNDLINDDDFANQYINYRTEQKYGPRRIAQELRNKGVAGEYVEMKLDEISEAKQLDNAIALAKKKFHPSGSKSDIYTIKQKMMQLIVRHGYNWDIARQAAEYILSEEQ